DGFEALTRDGTMTDGLKAFGNALLSGFGGALQMFGEAVVLASGLLEAVVSAFASLNPVAMAAAGFGLIAIGAMIKGAAGRAVGRGGAVSTPQGPVDTTQRVAIGSPGVGRGAPGGTSSTVAL